MPIKCWRNIWQQPRLNFFLLPPDVAHRSVWNPNFRIGSGQTSSTAEVSIALTNYARKFIISLKIFWTGSVLIFHHSGTWQISENKSKPVHLSTLFCFNIAYTCSQWYWLNLVSLTIVSHQDDVLKRKKLCFSFL